MAAAKKREYFIGLDMGTSSVGWAVTDPEYNIIKKAGRALWGIRLFDEASTAKDRRLHRAARRRTQRRAHRIDLLQELFAPEVSKVDPGFFVRLNESNLWEEDKKVKQPNSLFNDEDFTDKTYHKTYPTIYHLRYALMKERKTFDVRLVYLAIHHIIKYRGNFLRDSLQVNGTLENDFGAFYNRFLNAVQDNLSFELPEGHGEEVRKILVNRELSTSDKSKQLVRCFNVSKNKQLKELMKFLTGSKGKLSVLFADARLENTESISFAAGYDELECALQSMLGDDEWNVLQATKELYDWSLLTELMGNASTISAAQIGRYEKHKKDLKILKRLLKQTPEEYNAMFKGTGKSSYSAYIGMCKVKHEKVTIEKKTDPDEFFKALKTLVKNLPASEDRDYVLQELDQKNFLPKAVAKINGIIPYQLNEYELKRILENAESYLPFLKEKDKYGTISEKIQMLLTFRVPFYVGPLNGKSPYAWAAHLKDGPITPWNFNEHIDEEASARTFIGRMTNKCTYLIGKDVLPKNSLLYTEYMVLNTLNNIRIGDAEQRLTPELKEKLWNGLFLKYKKITLKKFSQFLIRAGIDAEEAKSIHGIDGDFKESLAPWIDMNRIFPNTLERETEERIIKAITLFSMDKVMLRKVIKKIVPEITKDQLKDLVRLKYRGWGRLSREFLTEIVPEKKPLVDLSTGEIMNIITALKKTSYNLMEIMGSSYGYRAAVEAANEKNYGEEKLTYAMVNKLNVSPAVKRPIWQTLKIIKEIQHIMGTAPKKIFIEMARGSAAKEGRKKSRKEQLIALYKKCKEDTRNWADEISKLTDADLRSDRLFLYYTQMGKSIYTGKPINIQSLWDKNEYDIDHIYPRSKTADDSLDNRVLVEKWKNAEKGDYYPISSEIRQQQKGFWKVLLDKGLISRKKYDRLVRATPLTVEELSDFVGRQLVETRQSTKAAAEILKHALPDTQIVYCKAKAAAEFRHCWDFVKVRELNDYHHAKDAYINIIVGNMYNTKFTSNPGWFIKEGHEQYTLNMASMCEHRIERNGIVAWMPPQRDSDGNIIPGKEGTIGIVRKWMRRNNILFTQMTYTGHGELFNVNLLKAGKGQVPIKQGETALSDIKKYGGYNSAATAYLMYVEGLDKKNNPVYILESVPLYKASQLQTIRDKESYCDAIWAKERNGWHLPKVKIENIPIQALLSIDGFKVNITSRSNNSFFVKSAEQLIVSEKCVEKLKEVLKFVDRRTSKKGKENFEEKLTSYYRIKTKDLINLYDVFLGKLENTIYKVKLTEKGKERSALLKNGRGKYIKLPDEDKCLVLAEILHLFQCNSVLANLKLIGEGGRVGQLSINKMLPKSKRIYLIYQSVTGFFEKRIQLAPYKEE